MLSSSSPRFQSPPPSLYGRPLSLTPQIYFRPITSSRSQKLIRYSLPPSNHHGEEEARWLREEQRWLREEQRWLREESRWNAERMALLQEIGSLKLRIQQLERISSASVSDTVGNIARLLQVLKESELEKTVSIIADKGRSTVPLILESASNEEDEDEEEEDEEEEEEREVVVKEVVVSIPERKETVIKRTTLRVGSEGDEVRAMQEALQKLGFYSGEEDMEYSSFSSGTERSVKTWQSSVKSPEDGIMTSELLDLLFGETSKQESPKSTAAPTKKNENGSTVKGTEKKRKAEKEDREEFSSTVSENRVFLLGENRWEEPSRLSRNGNKPIARKTNSSNAAIKCTACLGEGRLLCMECDGTGEPNVEPQLIEWVDEGAKCPYCEGLGHTTCDVCGGKTTV